MPRGDEMQPSHEVLAVRDRGLDRDDVLQAVRPRVLHYPITACFDRPVPCIRRFGGAADKFMGRVDPS